MGENTPFTAKDQELNPPPTVHSLLPPPCSAGMQGSSSSDLYIAASLGKEKEKKYIKKTSGKPTQSNAAGKPSNLEKGANIGISI